MWTAAAAARTRFLTSSFGTFLTRRPNAMFSNTVMCGNSARSWNTMPSPRSPGSRSLTTVSSMTMRPLVGASSPEIMFSVVVFPQPDGPTMIRNSPSRISRLIPFTAA
jgi:hypothetical protein